jgi:outer membrane lipoprotein-sorting protein
MNMSGMVRILVAGVVAAMTLAPLAEAAPAAKQPHPLSAEDRADIGRAEAYLNGITTLKARFLQVSSSGGSIEGDAYLSRPGKMRLQYDPPSPLLVVADGTFLIVHDRQLGDPSYIPLNSTPAGILVRSDIHLDGKDVQVTRVTRLPGVLRISMVEADDPGTGELTLVFSERPFALRQWQVLDAQNQVTTVSLYEAQTGLTLDPKLFEFKDPKFDKPKLNFGNG